MLVTEKNSVFFCICLCTMLYSKMAKFRLYQRFHGKRNMSQNVDFNWFGSL